MHDLRDRTSELEQCGIVKFEAMIAPERVENARAMVRDLARQNDLLVDGKWIGSASPFGYPKSFRNALNRLNRAEEFPELLDDRVQELIEELIGQPVLPLPPGQQLLFTLPGQESWAVPHGVWHLDMPRLGERDSPGLQAFTFLDDVGPRGGGTLVVAGSHRLLNAHPGLSSKQVKQSLRGEPYFRSLFDSSRPPITDLGDTKGQMHGVDLEICELSGKAGDVFLMDLRVLHAPAPNCSDKPRIMLTCRYPKASAAGVMPGLS